MTTNAESGSLSGQVKHLRLLATTDLHMQLVGHDYVADAAISHSGLAGLATLIADARAEAAAQGRACLLLDNGDILQGNPLGTWLARQPVTPDHPVVAALNALRYDAVGLGNHDLDFGLDYLESVVSHLNMPVVCSNLGHRDIGAIRTMTVLTCDVPAAPDERPTTLQIGVLSVVPEQTAIWNMTALAGRAEVQEAVPALTCRAAALRAQGADLVVLLAHMGIDPGADGTPPLDSAVPLAGVPGIDAIIAGHTHQRFPGIDHADSAAVDAVKGQLGDRPAIMAGHDGSDLAVMDLTVQQSPTGVWQVVNHKSGLRANHAKTPARPEILAVVRTAHEDARCHLAEPVGRIDGDLHNYFALAMPTATAGLIARAKALVARDALIGTPDGDLPVLASAAAHTTGGRSGPGHYLHIPKGVIRRRHLLGLAPYEDPIWALRMSGDDLLRWLEHAAEVYNQLGQPGPPLRLGNPAVPSFNFDTIYGLTYRIDPTRPVGSRISDLRHASRHVALGDRFILATNPFRIAGGGGFPRPSPDQICLRSETNLSQALGQALSEPGPLLWSESHPWRFHCDVQTQAVLETAPEACAWLDDLRHLDPVEEGFTKDGFVRLRLTL